MTRLVSASLAAGVLVVTLGGCNGSTPTGPTNTTTAIFSAALSPANEVPPVTNAESSGTGGVTISMYLTRDNANVLTNATADFNVNLTGFPAGTTLTMAHIHRGTVGGNGGVVVDTGLSPGDLIVLTNGIGGFAKNGVSVSPELAMEILNQPSTFYFNVHSTLNQNGMVRGQLIRQQ